MKKKNGKRSAFLRTGSRKKRKIIKRGKYDICGTRKVRDNHAILYGESGRCTVSSL